MNQYPTYNAQFGKVKDSFDKARICMSALVGLDMDVPNADCIYNAIIGYPDRLWGNDFLIRGVV